MNILDGKKVSTQILNDIKNKIDIQIQNSESRLGYQISRPSMAIVLVGNNPASESYVKGKTKACEKAGINYNVIRLDETISTFELLEGNVDIHTLSKQMGNSAAMIEKHYSKLTPTLAAKKLA